MKDSPRYRGQEAATRGTDDVSTTDEAPEFAGRPQCGCGPDERCFDCATDEELAASIPPWPSMGGESR